MSIEQKWNNLTPNKKTYYTQIALLTGYQITDVITTHLGVSSGLAHEGFVIPNIIQQNLGPEGYMAEKLLSVLLVLTAVETIKHLASKDPNADESVTTKANTGLRVANIVLMLWCINNTANLVIK